MVAPHGTNEDDEQEEVSGVAEIHRTTMEPTKLELVARWLPQQPWWAGGDRAPVLAPAGGFRLDDPDGEVGIELMIVTDASGAAPVAYFVPLSYRGAPLDGAEGALLGTSEHGVLGRRWIYDGGADPVALASLRAFGAGRVQAQDQNRSHELDPSVTVTGGPGDEVELVRVLGGEPPAATGYVTAGWVLPDGTAQRGPVALIR